MPPNMRLKLPGAYRPSGIGVLCPGGHELSFNFKCAGGLAARQLKRDPLGSRRCQLAARNPFWASC
jgi:hypothetical protein